MEKIKQHLSNKFKEYRIVFWYDNNAEMKDVFEEIQIDEVIKIEINNNEFSIKYRVMREETNQKFLIYSESLQPTDEENWLLDLNIAFHLFSADKTSLILQDIGLDSGFRELITSHSDFFKSKSRTDFFSNIINKDDSENELKMKMLITLIRSENDIEKVLFHLFNEYANGNDSKFTSITKFGFNDFFWNRINTDYAYFSETPSLKDLFLNLSENYFSGKLGKYILNRNALIFVSRWMDSSKFKKDFISISSDISQEINIKEKIESMPLSELLKTDIYIEVEQNIISKLINGILTESLPLNEISEIIKQRNNGFRFEHYKNIYSSIEFAVLFLLFLQDHTLEYKSLRNGFEQYIKQDYKGDFFYRKFIYYSDKAESLNVLNKLTELIENKYTNVFQLDICNKWQNVSENLDDVFTMNHQNNFFNSYIKHNLNSKKLFVIISDGLRYECAVELNNLLQKENRYSSKLETMFGMMPSFTSLGMASLLPHQKLSFDNNSEIAFVDNISSASGNRDKILKNNIPDSIALKADDFLNMTSPESRAITKNNNLIYLYHNGIDSTGDNAKTENKVFDAVEDEFEYIRKLLKKITNANGNNVIITSDHGFLYQRKSLDPSFYCDFDDSNISKNYGEVYKFNRRFILGKNLTETESTVKVSTNNFGISDGTETLIPKSLKRFRKHGSGVQFVHGGASLQEIVIPVIKFNKKRESDVSFVDVQVIKNINRITSNQTYISLFQTEVVTAKKAMQNIKMGFYTQENKLISNEITFSFDSKKVEAHERTEKILFIFKSEASTYNGETVYLKMKTNIKDTNSFNEYKKEAYTMNISFTDEFDSF